MTNVAQMYEDLRAQQGQEKVASEEQDAQAQAEAQELVMDADYFSKLASGDEDVTAHLQGVIKEASDQGFSDEEIDQSISELAAEAGVDLDQLFGEVEGEFEAEGAEKVAEEDDFEMQKVASFNEGAAQAIEDILENNELIKEGSVTGEDIAEYYLGQAFGEGYFSQRQEMEEAIEKIAAAKKKDKLKKRMMYAGGGAAGLAGTAYAGRKAQKSLQSMGGGSAREGAKGLGKAVMMKLRRAPGSKLPLKTLARAASI